MNDHGQQPAVGVVHVSQGAAKQELAEVIDRLYRTHHAAVFHLALRYGLGDEAWAEDVAQDVFIKLLDKLPSLDDHDQLDGWLYRVTSNCCLRRLRRDRLWNGKVMQWLLASVEPSQSIERQVFARRELERTRVALAKLPARERVVLSMCQLDGRSQQEVSEILGLSKGYVSKLLARGSARLEEELDD